MQLHSIKRKVFQTIKKKFRLLFQAFFLSLAFFLDYEEAKKPKKPEPV